MFSNKNKGNGSTTEMPRSISRSNTNAKMPSLIGSGLSITGNLKGDSEIQIDGNVEGNIKCRILTIGEVGKVNGKVNADEVVISGTFVGQIKAIAVSLTDSARVQGDITVREALSIESGAQFEGQCKRLQSGEKEKEKPYPAKFGAKDSPPEPTVVVAKSNSGFTPPKVAAT